MVARRFPKLRDDSCPCRMAWSATSREWFCVLTAVGPTLALRDGAGTKMPAGRLVEPSCASIAAIPRQHVEVGLANEFNSAWARRLGKSLLLQQKVRRAGFQPLSLAKYEVVVLE